MTKRNHLSTFSLTLLLFAGHSQAVAAESGSETWQQRRLMQPTSDELSWERAGHIMIYDGLTDRQVAAAMESHFNRIQSMMFTGIRVTEESGEPETDPDTGDIITEDDGC